MSTGYYLLDNQNPHAPKRSDGRRFWGHPGRYSKLRVIVLHVPVMPYVAAGPDPTAEKVAKYFATTNRAASAHVCSDADTVVQCLPADYTGAHVRGYNSSTWGIEMGYGTNDWNRDRKRTEAVLIQATKAIVPVVQKYQIPVRLLTKAQVDAGLSGFTTHARLDPARRSDPGATYPWEWHAEMITDALGGKTPEQTPENTMKMPLAAARLEVARIWMKQMGTWPTGAGSEDAQARLTRLAQAMAEGKLTTSDLFASLAPWSPDAKTRAKLRERLTQSEIPAWILGDNIPPTNDGVDAETQKIIQQVAAKLPEKFLAEIHIKEAS